MQKKCKNTGKRILNKQGAQTAVNSAMETSHKEMRMYLCENCGGYHLATVIFQGYKLKREKETMNDKRRVKEKIRQKINKAFRSKS